jgi:ribosomal protein L11 methylase PrmA
VVIDLGCGHGLLGILALLKGAKLVIFQDFNESVIKNVTIPNINVNTSGLPLKEKCRFLTGDWLKMQPFEQ